MNQDDRFQFELRNVKFKRGEFKLPRYLNYLQGRSALWCNRCKEFRDQLEKLKIPLNTILTRQHADRV